MKKKSTIQFWRTCLVGIALLFGNQMVGQDLINLTMTVTQVTHNHQCCDDAAGSCGGFPTFINDRPEPRYRVRGGYQNNSGGFTMGGVTIVNLGNGVTCGTYGRSDALLNVSGVCGDEIRIEVDMWEEDGCGSDNTFDNSCINDDENRSQPSINIPLGVPGTNSTTLSGSGGYSVTVQYTWSEVPAPSVSGTTTICEGQTTTLTASTSQVVGGASFAWYNAPTGGVLQFTGAVFTTPSLSTTTTYYVDYGPGGCATTRTPVTVTVTPATAPTVTAGSACPNASAVLSANAAGATGYNWYDDALMSTLLGTGATFNTPPLSGTTTFYVTAVYAGGCESAPVPVTATELPAPNAPSAGNISTCANQDVMLVATGSGGTLNWYNAPSAGVFVGSGSPLNIGQLGAGSYTYYVAESDGTCEGPRSAVIVTVNGLPNEPDALGTTVCSGASATLFASEPSATNFNWYAAYPLTVPVSSGAVYNTAPITTQTTFYVTTIDGNGCESDTTEVMVDVNVVAAATASGTSICPGDTAVLTASAPGSTQINWYQNSDKTGFLAAGASYTTAVLSSTTTYYVTAIYPNGCESLVTAVTVTVNTAPTLPAVANITLCASDSAIFSAFGSGGTISWYNAASGGTLLATGNTYNAGLLTAGNLVVFASEGNGSCGSGLAPALATIYANPTAPTVAPDTVCIGESATLSVTGGVGTFNWYSDAALTMLVFVGNNFSTPTLATNTTYYITEVNSNNCESPATQVEVVVNALPATPVTTPDTICEGNVATLMATNAGGTTNWYSNATGTIMVGTGTSLTTAVLNQNMTYYAQEVSAEGCRSGLIPATAVVNALPNRPSANTVVVCDGDDVILSATGSGVGDLVFYNNTPTEVGRSTMSLANPNATLNLGALAVGTYVYTVTEENNGCESTSESITVMVNTLPAEPVATNDGPVCEGDVIVLQATPPVTGGIFSWTGPNGFVSNNQTIVLSNVTAAQVGMYTVNVTVGSCTSTDGSTNVVVNAKPTVGALTNNGPLCEGDMLTLTAPTQANVTYDWEGPNGFTASGNPVTTGPVSANNNQGIYAATVIDNATGCASDKEFTLVQVNDLPNANMIMSNSPLCEGNDLTLSVPSVFGATYAWTGPNGFTATVNAPTINSANQADAGSYTVVVDNNGCSVTLNTATIVNANPTVSMISDTTIYQGDNIVLWATGGTSYTWAPSMYLDNPSLPTPILSGAPIGTHSYTVNVTTAEGCTGTASTTVMVEPQTQLAIVDLFTPNGDGVNDTWEVNFLQNIGAYTINVFSRGGLQVMTSENYASDWDGTHNGKQLPEGTYYYVIRTADKEFKGPVTIKR